MSRSFQIVEDKIEEAEFFLDKLLFENVDFTQFDFRAAYFYLSAFLSAVRSITFFASSNKPRTIRGVYL